MAKAQSMDAPTMEQPDMEQPVKVDRMKNIVEVYIPRIPGEDPNLWVAVNGRRYLLPRGKTSKVPEPVAKRALEAEAAREQAYDYVQELKKKHNTELARI